MKDYNESYENDLNDLPRDDSFQSDYDNDSFLADDFGEPKKVQLSDSDFVSSFTDVSLDSELTSYEEHITSMSVDGVDVAPTIADNDDIEISTIKGGYDQQELIGNDTYYRAVIKEQPTAKKESSFKKFVAALLIISLVGGSALGLGIGIGGPLADKYFAKSVATTTNTDDADAEEEAEVVEDFKFNEGVVPTTEIISPSSSNLIKGIVKIAEPSVVNISSIIVSQQFNYWSSFPSEQEGSGSGIIFHKTDSKIFIVTNNHVISDATYIKVSFNDNEQITAALVGRDEQSDLAVLSINTADLNNDILSKIRVAGFGESDDIEVGDTAVAIGNALGEGKSATAGIISAKNKEIIVGDRKLNMIKTDAAINPGNSGGALVNDKGQVIGINTAKYAQTGVEGTGYAIPINDAKPVIEQLINYGAFPRPYLGITGDNVSDEKAEIYGLPIGVLVREVMPGSSAAVAGMQPTDIIIEFGETKIMDFDSLTGAIKACKVGDSVDVKIIRNGNTPMTLKVILQDANQRSNQPNVRS